VIHGDNRIHHDSTPHEILTKVFLARRLLVTSARCCVEVTSSNSLVVVLLVDCQHGESLADKWKFECLHIGWELALLNTKLTVTGAFGRDVFGFSRNVLIVLEKVVWGDVWLTPNFDASAEAYLSRNELNFNQIILKNYRPSFELLYHFFIVSVKVLPYLLTF